MALEHALWALCTTGSLFKHKCAVHPASPLLQAEARYAQQRLGVLADHRRFRPALLRAGMQQAPRLTHCAAGPICLTCRELPCDRLPAWGRRPPQDCMF